ncbi:MAG: Rieske (2Fe-2S) protein [Myxococcota bacterium]|nr:Rieske (2Fe-2S) protein [Myxococcota bacterium]
MQPPAGYAFGVRLRHVATYDRHVGASLERAWENVRDWEHLPFLHASSFRSIDLIESGGFGWRARIGLHPAPSAIVLELVIDQSGDRYVSRTLEGPGEGGEIWTTLSQGETKATTQVEVEFHLPGLESASQDQADAVGASFRSLYEKLWDEDEGMMRWRARELEDRRRPRSDRAMRIELGSLDDLYDRLPLAINERGRRVRVALEDGQLFAHSGVCPHWLGPLAADDVGFVCPWHGYRFDREGRSCDGHALSLETPPRIEVDARDGQVALVWAEARG